MRWRDNQVRRPQAGQTLVYLKPSFDFSLSAVAFAVVMVLIGVAAANTQTNLFFGVFGLMAGVLVFAGLMSYLGLHRVGVERQLPEYLAVGTEEVVVYRLTNRKRFWPVMAASVGELDDCHAFTLQPYAYVPHAAAGETVEVRCHITPRRRGVYTLRRYQVSSSFPFGFIARAAIQAASQTIVVFPALGKVRPRLLQMCQSAENSGAPMRPQHGGEDEFYGAKEYREGENPRWINWKRSARTGDLIMKVMTRVSPPRLVLLVDTCSEGDDAESQARVERVVAMAASLASDALEKGYPVGVCAWNDGWVQIHAARGKRQRVEILTALARLPRNRRHSAVELLAAGAALVSPGATRVLLTPDEQQPQNRGRGMLVLSARGAFAASFFTFEEGIDFAFASPAGTEASLVGPLRPADVAASVAA